MTTNSKILAFTSASLKTGVGSLVVFGLMGCDGLARFTAKPDTKPTEIAVAEETVDTISPGPDQPTSNEAADPPEKDKKLSAPLYEWKGDGRRITRIVVDTNDQKARFYSGDEEIGWSTVATGLPKYPTPTGRFQVTEKVENKRSNLYGKVYGKGGRVLRSNVKVGRDPIPDGARFEGAHMPFFMRLTDDGVGLHAGPIPNPGQPASHGCIRMPSKIAPVVFRHVSNGTAVTIEGKGPNYGDYVAKQRANAARRAEEQRIAAQRAAEARKAQQLAQAESAPDTAGQPTAEVGTAAPESHAVAKDDATAAAQTLDATNARETRMREPVAQPETATPEASAPAVSPTSPETAAAKPAEQTTTPSAPEATEPAPTPSDATRPSIIEAAPPAASVGGSQPATGGPGPQASAPATSPEPAPRAEPPAPAVAKPVPEIQETPAPAVEASAPTPQPTPTPTPTPAPKPAEPTPVAAPADSAAQ